MLCIIIRFTIEPLMCKTDIGGWVECLTDQAAVYDKNILYTPYNQYVGLCLIIFHTFLHAHILFLIDFLLILMVVNNVI